MLKTLVFPDKMASVPDPSYKQRIKEYEANPTLCAKCGIALSYSDLRPLSAAISQQKETCSRKCHLAMGYN